MFSKMQGLLFPDDYLVRFFFKNELNELKGSVLELGCGSGNNLMLFYEFGWNITGIDINSKSILQAKKNLQLLPKKNNLFNLIEGKVELISELLPKNDKYDVIILSNIICYISRNFIKNIFAFLREILLPHGFIFLRTRTVSDYRYARGDEIAPNEFILRLKETGEEGLLNVFYQEWELVELVWKNLNIDLSKLTILHVDFDNVQNGKIIRNSDLVLWGKCG